MAITLNLPGRQITPAPVEPELAQILNVEVLRVHEVPVEARDGSIPFSSLEGVRDDDLVEVEYQSGIKQWFSAAQLRADLKDEKRSAGASPDEVTIPVYGLYSPASRDWKQAGLRLISVLRTSPVDNFIDIAADTTADVAARKIAAHFEKQLKPGPGLYRMKDTFECGEPYPNATDTAAFQTGQPWLLFVHGTASSTLGSFSSLAVNIGTGSLSILRSETPEWAQLQRFYGGRILALEHSTLSESPITNAIEAATLLPANMTIHLVTHSRGGLVGELLCLQNIDDAILAQFQKKRPEDAKKLSELAGILKEKNFRIERFVRVACPSRGTILASTRLDWYLSVLLNVIGYIPILHLNPAYAYLKATMLELIKRRAQPEFLPGLEAQMPSSPLIHLLNRSDLSTQADLAVIAGDLEGQDLLGRLKVMATDLFYWKSHDLVVNTDAMYGGLARKKAYFYFDRGAEVNHFQYFRNHRTRDLLVNWLTQPEGKQADTGFEELQRGAVTPLRKGESRGAENAPIVLLVGDLMTTHLHDSQGRVWLDFDALMRGGLDRIAADAPHVSTGDVIGDVYQQLVTYLSGRFEVVLFPYDWRQSSEKEGTRLADELGKLLVTKRVVHLVAHGFGGLLVESALAPGSPMEQQFKKAGGRIVSLGAPFAGQEFPEKLGQLLTMMDPGRDAAEIEALMKAWPSFQETLPANRPAKRRELPNFIYVAGTTALTPGGDGRVTHAEAGGAIDYYIEAAHGDLLNYRPAFPAITELIDAGRTAKLRTTPVDVPSSTTGQAEMVLFPNQQDLFAAAIGSIPTKRLASEWTLEVSVLNADLAESNYPVMVGHYQGSTIAGGESRLDEVFDGALTRRMQMNVYPGAPGTVDFVSMPHKRPRGAVIAGLGETHALRPEHVRSAVLKAALHYANALAEKQEDAEVTQWQSAAFSCLLIGTRGSEPLNASASVAAIVQAALEANRGLRANGLWDRVRIDAVQFVEIYEDVAIEAAHAIAALPGSLLSLMEEGERISPAELLDVKTGSRPQRPFDLYDAGWWRRIQIECKEKNGRQRYLKYVVTTDRARAEETGSVTQITMLDHFVAAAIGSPSFDRTLATALYSALLPNRIKEQLRDRADLVLELDRDAAQYPWELLTPVSAVEAEPLVTTLGLIRQFKTSEFEQRPRTIAAKKALVIGDPLLDEKTKLKFRELKGAREEAYLVQKLLETNGYAVTPVIQKGAHDAFLRLYSEEFKVLHLAGHGVFDDNGVTGMVLGDGLFLTAEDLNNLAFVPELAFLNCCHLARVGEEEPDLAANRQRLQSVNRLAASVAEALIKKGAKAVVAAGWAVSDAAALTFAEKLYGLLLDDQPFGRAVLEARKEVFRRHKETNTWGAYQCYGDPEFKLNADTTERPKRRTRPERSRREILERCRNLLADVRSKSGAAREPLREQARNLYRAVPPQWRDGEVLGRIGEALAWLGEFELAIEAYREAIRHPDSQAPIRLIEQLGNIEDRYARILAQDAADDPDESRRAELRAKAAEYTSDAVNQLQWVLNLGRTAERLSLFGGAYKRLAVMGDEAKRDEYLELSAQHYEEAYRLDENDTYPLLNYLTLRAVLAKRKDKDNRSELQPLLDHAKKLVENRIETKGDFWARVGRPDSEVVASLVEGSLRERLKQLKKSYSRVVEPGTSDKEKQSVRAQLAWLQQVWPDAADNAALKEIERTLS